MITREKIERLNQELKDLPCDFCGRIHSAEVKLPENFSPLSPVVFPSFSHDACGEFKSQKTAFIKRRIDEMMLSFL